MATLQSIQDIKNLTGTNDTSNLVTGNTNIPVSAVSSVTPIDINSTMPTLQPLPTLQNYAQQYSDAQATTPEELQSKSLADTLYNLYGQEAGKAADTNAAYQNADVFNKKAKIDSIAKQIDVKNAQYQAYNTNYEANLAGNGGTAFNLSAQNNTSARAQAADIMLLNSQAAMAAGDYNLALDTAKRVIDMKYALIEEAIAIKEKQQVLIQPFLTAAQKKQSDATTYALDKQKIDLADKKANDKTIQDMFIAAQSSQAPQNIIDNANAVIKNGGTPLDVARALGKYGGDYQKAELLKEQIKTEKLNQSKIIADTNKVTAETLKTGTSGVSQYQIERATRTVQSVDELLPQVNNKTVGAGSLLSGIPNTDAKYFKTQVDTLIANITYGELTAMREASKTGGALGQVSDKEGQLLGAALGALSDRAITPEQYKIQLQKVKDSIVRWNTAQGITLPENNPFKQSLGETAPIPGTSITSGVSSDGSINFVIPNKK